MGYLPALHSDAETQAWLAATLQTQRVAVAVAEGVVVGFSAVEAGTLRHLYVAPSAQGRGVGGALLQALLRDTPGRLVLFVFQRNRRARAFYERHGFTLVSEGDGADNEEREPDALYASGPAAGG